MNKKTRFKPLRMIFLTVLILLLTLFLMNFVNANNWTDGGLNNSLISYYKLDETSGTVIDSLGVNNGTNYGAQTNIQGKIGTSYNFTGSQLDSVNFSSGQIVYTNSTISAWIKPTRFLADGSNMVFFGKDSSSVRSYIYGIHRQGTTQGLSLQWGTTTVWSTFNLSVNNWYHAVITFNDVTNTVTFYVNGSNVTVKQNTGSPTNSSSSVFLGKREYVGGEEPFDGYIDEVAFWSRILTNNEILTLYNNGIGLNYSLTPDCIPNIINSSWSSPINTSCNITDLLKQSQYLIQYDTNLCGSSNITYWNNQTFSCNYCSFYPFNATIQDWMDISTCNNLTSLKTQNSSILTYDFNFDTCYSLTGLESDLFENITYNLERTIFCSIGNESLFYIDLESKTTVVMFIFMFVFIILLGYFRKWLFVGGLLVIMGFILLFNDFNIIISFITISSGVLAFFLD